MSEMKKVKKRGKWFVFLTIWTGLFLIVFIGVEIYLLKNILKVVNTLTEISSREIWSSFSPTDQHFFIVLIIGIVGLVISFSGLLTMFISLKRIGYYIYTSGWILLLITFLYSYFKFPNEIFKNEDFNFSLGIIVFYVLIFLPTFFSKLKKNISADKNIIDFTEVKVEVVENLTSDTTSHSSNIQPPPKPSNQRKNLIVGISIFVFVILVIGIVLLNSKHNSENQIKENVEAKIEKLNSEEHNTPDTSKPYESPKIDIKKGEVIYFYKCEGNDMADIQLKVYQNDTFELYFKNFEGKYDVTYLGKVLVSQRFLVLIFGNKKPVLSALFDKKYDTNNGFTVQSENEVEIDLTAENINIWGINCPREYPKP